MTLYVPVQGEVRMLNVVLNTGSSGEHPMMRFFSNSIAAANTTHLSSLTEVAGGYGYTPVVCSGGSWTITSGTPSEAAFAQQTITFTASFGNVHGYYFVHSQAASLLWAENFTGGPYNMVNSGDKILVTPKLTLT